VALVDVLVVTLLEVEVAFVVLFEDEALP
jgi:hypothetical protein